MWNHISGNSWAFGLGGGYPDSSDEEDNGNDNVDSMQDIVNSSTNAVEQQGPENISTNSQHTEDQGQGYPLPEGFEEGTDSQETNHVKTALAEIAERSKPSPDISPPTSKKSPRRDEDGEEDQDQVEAKRLKKSLFGGFGDEEESDEEDNIPTPGQSGFDDLSGSRIQDNDIGSQMFGLRLTREEPEEDDSPNELYDDGDLDDVLSDGNSSDEESSSPPPQKPDIIPYDLRRNVERLITGACMDVDKSGDYDPEEEARKEKIKKARARLRRKQAKQGRPRQARVEKCIVRLRLGEKFGNVLNVFEDVELNWPEGWSDDESEADQDGSLRVRYRERTPGCTQKPIPDPKGIRDDITGDPRARGCKNCYRKGHVCSMLGGGECPCGKCEEDEISCEPIRLPLAKAKCNHCIDDLDDDEENYCSFEMRGIEAHDVCLQCQQASYDDCIPSNLKGYAVPRIDMDQLAWGPERKHTSCTNCRMTRKKCSIKNKTNKGPCKQCSKASKHCHFEDTPPKIDRRKKAHRKKIGGTSQAESSRGRTRQYIPPQDLQPTMDLEDIVDLDAEEEIALERSPSPPIILNDALGRRGVLKEIATCWAHPIEFNSENSTKCNFCSIPMFGMTGFHDIRVNVLEWLNGLGYTEITPGHGVEYEGQTVMCANCTITRLQTIMCPGHKICPKLHKITEDEAVQKLFQADEQSDEFLRRLRDWCSFCYRIATHKCHASQPSLAAEEDDEQNMLPGCGLRLCDICEVRLRNEFRNSSTTMAAALDADPKHKEEDGELPEGHTRADVEFLREDGLLMKNVMALT